MAFDAKYYWSLLKSVPPAALGRGAGRKLGQAFSRRAVAAGAAEAGAFTRAAAAALSAPPRLFTSGSPERLRAGYRRIDRGALDRAHANAARAAIGGVQVFGESHLLGRTSAGNTDFRRDVFTGRLWLGGAAPLLVDPKGVWEPAKLSHLVQLAVGVRLFPENATAWLRSFCDQAVDFVAEGARTADPHWASPLEVSLRLINLVTAWAVAGPGAAWPPGGLQLMARLIAEHALFVRGRVEDRGLVIGTHALGDLCGLLFAGAALRGIPAARQLADSAFRRFRRYVRSQILADGLDFEGSTSYHRFAIELVLAALLYSRSAWGAFDSELLRRLRAMLFALWDTVLGDEEDPNVGDGDDAGVLSLVPRPSRARAHLAGLGAVLLPAPELQRTGRRPPEEVVWVCGPDAVDRFLATTARAQRTNRSFPQAGLHILRAGGTELLFRAGSYGQDGVGGHAHNDQLSFVLHRAGVGPVVVDPGTFTYCGSPAHRNRFRSTEAHATLSIDGEEQSPLPRRPFALPDAASTTLLRFDAARLHVAAEHRGYARLPGRIMHRRSITLSRDGRSVLVRDDLFGRGSHSIRRSLPLAASLTAWHSEGSPSAAWRDALALDPEHGPLQPLNQLAMQAEGTTLYIGVFTGLGSLSPRVRAAQGWVSPNYGSRERALVIEISERRTLPATLWLAFLFS